jgi:hypothetical protein
MVEVVKHLESVSQWKKTVDDLREQKKKRRNPKQYYCRTKKRKIYDN